MTGPAPAAPALPVRWRLLTILTASYGAGAFGMLGISPLSPSLVEGLGLTRFQVAFLVPSIYLSGLLFSMPGGRLADRLGVRPSFLGGLAVAAIGLLAAALAPGFLAFLVCLFVAGSGWSVVNPALGKAIMDVFPVSERGIAMGVKQMGLTLGGLVAALALPALAATLGWRPLAAFHAGVRGATSTVGESGATSWWWARRPALVVFFATGFVLGMVQGAVLSYLPLFTIQGLGFDKIGAGLLVAASQAGGAVSRLALGAASDRWAAGRRSLWLAFTGAVGAAIFLVYAVWPATSAGLAGLLAFATGVGAYGWVGIFFVISVEAGGRDQAGLLSGVAFASIVLGLLVGPLIFGLLFEGFDSYAVAWAVFVVLSGLVAIISLLAGPAIDRESRA